MLMCEICVFTECYAYMSKDLRHLIVTEYLPYSYFCHTLFAFFWLQSWASTSDGVQRHGGMYTGGHIWPGLVPGEHGSTTLVLSVRQPVSQPVWGEKKGREGVKTHTAREGARVNGGKTSIPSSQSQSTEPLKWCRISPETCRAELGEGGPTLLKTKVLPRTVKGSSFGSS